MWFIDFHIIYSILELASVWKIVSEWVSLMTFLSTADIGVHVVHTSRVIISYTLESLSSLTEVTHNLQKNNKSEDRDSNFLVVFSSNPLAWLVGLNAQGHQAMGYVGPWTL